MQNINLLSIELSKAIELLNKSKDHRVVTRYKKPELYNIDPNISKKIGVFLDIEATGLSFEQDKLIELGMVKFEYSEDGRIFRILEEFDEYQDPGVDISDFITKLTGISNDMVSGKKINEQTVTQFLNNVDLVIAHNAKFDRVFFEKTFPNIEFKAWGCSMHNINWRDEGVESAKLEYIAYKYNFFYEGHRALIDCLVGVHILSQKLYNSNQLVFKQLLDNISQISYKLWAKNAPYECKDLLKDRKYKWEMHPHYGFKACSVEVKEDLIADEINYLKTKIYKSTINIPIEIIDAYNRFSVQQNITVRIENDHKYINKMSWIKQLQEI